MPSSSLEALLAHDARVALWGWGREGRAAYRALRGREPVAGSREPEQHSSSATMPLTLFCNVDEVAGARALGDPALTIETDATAKRLAAHDIVIKSPGISPYRAEAIAAAAQGTRFIGGTALWFAAHAGARTVCVTGTKGKSTSTALLAHLLRAANLRTALCGNIGLPLLELIDDEADVWAIELSSYQTRDVAASGVRPEVAVVTNIFPEHLDWHGSEQRYVEDKLALLTEAKPRIAVLNAQDARLAALSLPDSDVRWFAREDGWHLRGDALYRGGAFVFDSAQVPLPGRHNRGNLCAVLTAIDALGIDAAPLAQHALTFQPLPHRLQTLGVRDGITWVNDSISTTPHATLAALDVFCDRCVALLVGGHDRGLDWSGFAAETALRAPHAIVTMGQNGGRIHALLEPSARTGAFVLEQASGLGEAMALAKRFLTTRAESPDGVVLLSPGAPSFGAYRDYTERGRHFAQLAGFDPVAISGIAGLGIA